MNGPLLFDQVLAAAAWAGFTEWEIHRNATLIAQNGSQDNLKAGFHQRRGWIRFWWWLGLALAGSVLAPSLGRGALAAGGLGLGLLGYFVRTFNPRLNAARALTYVYRFSVSFAPDAATWPDRWLAGQAIRRYPADPFEQRVWAQRRLQLVLNLSLLVGLAAWLSLGYLAAR